MPTATGQMVEFAPRWWLLSPAVARAGLLLLIAASVAAGLLVQDAAASAQAISAAGADLTRLLQMMAVLKASIAVGLSAAVIWRLGAAVTPARLAAYSISCSAMATGPLFIWNMAHVIAGTLLLHGGLLATIVLMWRDPAVGDRLATIVAARRQRSRQSIAPPAGVAAHPSPTPSLRLGVEVAK